MIGNGRPGTSDSGQREDPVVKDLQGLVKYHEKVLYLVFF